MVDTFASRLSLALTHAGVPDDRFRRKRLAEMFTVSIESARKWLMGEAIPATKRIPAIATRLGVTGEWLLTGQGEMVVGGRRTAVPYAQRQSQTAAEPPARLLSWPIIEWENPDDLPDGQYVIVPRVRVRFSAGNGQMIFEEEEGEPLAFTTRWVKSRGLSRSQLVLVEAVGDSMEPRIHSGDLLLIDRAQHPVQEGQIYAIRYGEELRVKRLYLRYDGGLIIRSDNAGKYPEEAVPRSDVQHIEVIGRVVWIAGEV